MIYDYDRSCQGEIKGDPLIEVCYRANGIPYLSNSHLDTILDSRARELQNSLDFKPFTSQYFI